MGGGLHRVYGEQPRSVHLAREVVDAVFGSSELTLRLPTLVGAVLYLLSAALLCGMLFTRRLLAVMAFAAVALNPFVLDFLVAARGYGLGLGLLLATLLAALHATGRREQPSPERWCAVVSILLGLSVTANPCFAFAAIPLGLGAFAVVVGARGTRLILSRRNVAALESVASRGHMVARCFRREKEYAGGGT